MVRRQDNPILLWLIAEAVAKHARYDAEEGYFTYWVGVWFGRLATYNAFRAVCRWLDAEDEWLWSPEMRGTPATLHSMWIRARMAEAGVL